MSLIGKNIKKIRTVKKLSQADFAKLFNLARPSVGAYEEGRAEPKIETVIQIAQHFGLSIDRLLTKEITINQLYHFQLFEDENQPFEKLKQAKTGIRWVDAQNIYDYQLNKKNKDFLAALPKIDLPQEKGISQLAFEVVSYEMKNVEGGILPGDVLNTEKVSDFTKLSEGKVYLVFSKGHIYLQRLKNAEKVLLFEPDNPESNPLRISTEEIDELWQVIGVYSTHLKQPTSLEERMLQMEKEVQALKTAINSMQK